jgi:hypothetical protein
MSSSGGHVNVVGRLTGNSVIASPEKSHTKMKPLPPPVSAARQNPISIHALERLPDSLSSPLKVWPGTNILDCQHNDMVSANVNQLPPLERFLASRGVLRVIASRLQEKGIQNLDHLKNTDPKIIRRYLEDIHEDISTSITSHKAPSTLDTHTVYHEVGEKSAPAPRKS